MLHRLDYRCRFLACIAICLAAWSQVSQAAPRVDRTEFVLGSGRDYQTRYYVFSGRNRGPTVLIQAGIHGDETAGVLALDSLAARLQVHSGKVIILPRMNAPAVAQGKRFINVDLNRVFGAQPKRRAGYEFALADEITNLVDREGVEYLVTLHESSSLYDERTNAGLGQTICYGVKPAPRILAPWVERINSEIHEPQKFKVIYYPIPTSSTEVLVERFALKGGFCVETWKGYQPRRRIAMQLLVAQSFLVTAKIDFDLDAQCSPRNRYIRLLLRTAGLPSYAERFRCEP